MQSIQKRTYALGICRRLTIRQAKTNQNQECLWFLRGFAGVEDFDFRYGAAAYRARGTIESSEENDGREKCEAAQP